MQKNRYFLFSVIIILVGISGTIFSAWFYIDSQIQPGISYKHIPFQKGMSFTTWGAYSFNSTQAKEEIIKMKEIGIEWIAVNIWWYQESITSSEIYAGRWTDTAANITAFFKYIHSQGMKILFKPMLDPEDGNWRSNIIASDEWIKEYARFIKYTAEIAENGSVEIFSIGCEMGNWQTKSDDVVALIEDVRKIFSGKLTYAANHDSFWYIDWWDKVDIIGLDAYFPFTLSYNPSLEDMISVWNGFYDEFNKFQKKWQKPIIFAEIGCQNRDGCNIAPNDVKFTTKQDEDEFKMFYESFFKSKIWTAPWFKGAYWWIWDCREIDELKDNGFTPQLPIIKSTLHKYYSEKREIIYQEYWAQLILILILGGLITLISILIVRKYYIILLDNPIKEKTSKEMEDIKNFNNIFYEFGLIAGILFGIFLFWSFTYYNQALFNILYSIATKSIFLEGDIFNIMIALLILFILALFIWILIHRFIREKEAFRSELITIILIICSVMIFLREVYFIDYLASEVSIAFYFTILITILLGTITSLTFLYGSKTLNLADLNKIKRNNLIAKLILEIIAISSIIIIILSLLMKNNAEIPSISIGILLLLSTLPIYRIIRISLKEKDDNNKNKNLLGKKRKKEIIIFEITLCLFAFSYYFGILRYYDPHALINFNLNLLPEFFIPIGFSLLLAIPLSLGTYELIKLKKPQITSIFDFTENPKLNVIMKILSWIIFFSLIIILLGWFFSKIAYEIALILGGIPLLTIFIILIIGLIDSEKLFKENFSWNKIIIYLMIFLTTAFTANGIMVALLYAMTFLTIENGQIVVKTAFGEQFGFDAIQLIYNIQLFASLIPILIYAIILQFLSKKNRN
ncbi:MAG: glycoside hydrolase family 113 [Promethearchaeota archaeon]